MKHLALFAFFILAAGPAWAESTVHIEHAWARATVGAMPNGAAYVALTNVGNTADALTGATTPAAEKAEVHTHEMTGDRMVMKHLPELALAPGQTVTFAPGGHHIMLMGLSEPLKEGSEITLTLTFRNADPVTLRVPVLGLAAKGPAAAMHHHGGHTGGTHTEHHQGHHPVE